MLAEAFTIFPCSLPCYPYHLCFLPTSVTSLCLWDAWLILSSCREKPQWAGGGNDGVLGLASASFCFTGQTDSVWKLAQRIWRTHCMRSWFLMASLAFNITSSWSTGTHAKQCTYITVCWLAQSWKLFSNNAIQEDIFLLHSVSSLQHFHF